MKLFNEPITLGRTGVQVGRLGISSSYGAPTEAFEEAFEKGCNYFVIGSFPRGRSKGMIEATHNIVQKGHREKLVICMMEYTHSYLIGKGHFYKGLKKLGVDYVDVLMLGYYPRKPRNRVMDLAMELERIALEDDYFVSKKLYPNVDFYSGIIYKALGIPISMFTVMFAIARTVGWVSQWLEQEETPTPIGRPRQVYAGPVERDYTSIESR